MKLDKFIFFMDEIKKKCFIRMKLNDIKYDRYQNEYFPILILSFLIRINGERWTAPSLKHFPKFSTQHNLGLWVWIELCDVGPLCYKKEEIIFPFEKVDLILWCHLILCTSIHEIIRKNSS